MVILSFLSPFIFVISKTAHEVEKLHFHIPLSHHFFSPPLCFSHPSLLSVFHVWIREACHLSQGSGEAFQ